MKKEYIIDYLEKLISTIYKILPLYEDRVETTHNHVANTLFELNGLEELYIEFKKYAQFKSLLATLESLYDECLLMDDNDAVVKSNVFKCIDIVKKIKDKL